MAETNALPTEASVKTVRPDLDSYLDGQSITYHMDVALLEIKRILEDRRSIMWAMVYDTTNDLYFDNADSTGRNQDRLQQVIRLLTVAYVFKAYSVKRVDDGLWWALFEDFEKRAIDMLLNAKLDVDRDDSGEISSDEEAEDGQIFLGR